MAILKQTYIFKSDVKKVWNLVTDLNNQNWRTNIKNIEIYQDGQTFVEHTVDEYVTTIKINILEPFSRYEFNFENENMTGSWLGIFEEHEEGCQVTFIENVEAKRTVSKPFTKEYVKAQMTAYLRDLCVALGEELTIEYNAGAYSGFNNMSLAVAVGVALGVVFDNIALGICFGILGGVIIGGIKR